MPAPPVDSESEQEPPAPNSPVPAGDEGANLAAAVITRGSAHPFTHPWGNFTLRFRPISARCPSARWEAVCPYHKVSESTGCTKTLTIANLADGKPCPDSIKENEIRCKHWLNRAGDYNRRYVHKACHPLFEECPPLAVIEATRYNAPVPAVVLTDDLLDDLVIAGEVAEARGRGTATCKNTAAFCSHVCGRHSETPLSSTL